MIRLATGLTLVLTVMLVFLAGCGALPPPASALPRAAAPAPTAAPALPTAALSVPAAPVTVAINCGCVQGGDGDNSYRWLTDDVAPRYEARMRQQGKNVQVKVIQGTVDD